MRSAEEPSAFGALLRQHRLAAGLTQEELAARSGLGTRSIQHLERGAHLPQREALRLLASSLALADEQRARFEEAAQPRPRGPRGDPSRAASRVVVSSPNLYVFPSHASATDAIAVAQSRHNRPAQLTSFVGRQRELIELGARLRAGARLLSLTGTGGCGKTRLALQVGSDLAAEYADGVWLVELAPLTDPALVLQTVAAVVDVREEPSRPLLVTLVQALRAKRLLLLLDNCEHLVEASARLADALRRGCPDLQILATSRESLGIPGEVSWRVPSLAVPPADHLPPLDELIEIEAVRLFVNRAEAVVPGFTVTSQNTPALVQICRRLDGIPLALELAAARLTGLSVEQLAVRLDQRFRLLTGGSRAALPRQQTLAALVGWSYDLLSDAERTLFDRLAVFAGGFTDETAEAICADEVLDVGGQGSGQGGGPILNLQHPILREDLLDLLLRLVEKSLVLAEASDGGAERYRLLETLRQYAQEKLVARGEAETRQARHADYFAQRLAEVTTGAIHQGQQLSLSRSRWLEREYDNLRAALHWLRERGDVENALRLATLLVEFWQYHGFLIEGRTRLREILALPGASAPTSLRAAALDALANLARRQTDYTAARALFAERLALNRNLGDARRVGRALWHLANVAFLEATFDVAQIHVQRALAVAEDVNDPDLREDGNFLLGEIALHEGKFAVARQFLERRLRYDRPGGETLFVAYATSALGWIALGEGETAEARGYFAEAFAIGQSFGVVVILAHALEGTSGLAAAQGQLARAARLAGAAAAQRQRVGAPNGPAWGSLHERWLGPARQAPGAAAFAAAWAEGQAMTLEQAISHALEDDYRWVNARGRRG